MSISIFNVDMLVTFEFILWSENENKIGWESKRFTYNKFSYKMPTGPFSLETEAIVMANSHLDMSPFYRGPEEIIGRRSRTYWS